MTTQVFIVEWDTDQQASVRLNPTPDAIASWQQTEAGRILSGFGAAEWRIERRTYTEWLRVSIERTLYPPIRLAWTHSRVRYNRSIAAQDARTANRIYGHFEWR